MSQPIDSVKLDTCGCCEAGFEEPSHLNPRGLPALNYRIGTHPTFLERMKARIFQWELLSCAKCGQRFAGEDRLTAISEHILKAHPLDPASGIVPSRPLESLRTRASDDPAIALMDAASTVADVLSFYQERIANEGFLRTAKERRSILELARAVGYELKPGVAAETYLVFTVDDAKGSPPTASVPAGTQIQSVPAKQGELPQTFETTDDFEARVSWNALRPPLKRPQTLLTTSELIYLEGVETGLEQGDLVLLEIPNSPDSRTFPRVISVGPDAEAARTKIELLPVSTTSEAASMEAASLDLTPQDGEPQEYNQVPQPFDLTADAVETHIFKCTWKEADLQAFLALHKWAEQDVLAYVAELRAAQFQDNTQHIFAFRERLGFFGHNAPPYCGVPVPQGSVREDVYPVNWDDVNRTSCAPKDANDVPTPISIWQDPNVTDAPDYSENRDHDVFLERTVSGIPENSWVVFRSPTLGPRAYTVQGADETSMAAFALMGKVTGLTLTSPNTADDFKVRETTAYVKSEELTLAAEPITTKLAKGDMQLKLDTMVFGLQEGQIVALTGQEADTDGHVRQEILALDGITHNQGYTKLTFAEGLKYSYKRDTVTINANVVRANHGETVAEEILGGGDGSKPHQRFALKKPPLTHVSASTSSGSQSTLSVRADGVEWKQVSSLYGLDGNAESHIVRINNEGQASVIFGDGKSGARLSTGQENVRATYRSGIGSSGEVGAGSLTLLKARPPGIRSVTNPFKASGGQDPEKLDDARVNAPLTVLTLDRIVSVQDYEDFARGFAGIGKAKASLVWDGVSERIHITVADANGDEVVSPLYDNLLDAIESARDPLREVDLESFQPRVFFVTAAVLRDERYLWEDVKKDIEAALLEAFSFKKRAFAQPVTAAEVLKVIHGVAGVKAVDINELYQAAPDATETADKDLSNVLDSQPARYCETETEAGIEKDILPAQLLLIHELGVNLTEMTV